MTDEKKTPEELEAERKRKAAVARRGRELRNIREAEETEEAIEQWRESKYQD